MTMAKARKERNKPGPKPGPKRIPIYLEVPEAIRQAMEGLAREARRTLTSECIVALEYYIASKQVKDGGSK
jgi:hypothetical protein